MCYEDEMEKLYALQKEFIKQNIDNMTSYDFEVSSCGNKLKMLIKCEDSVFMLIGSELFKFDGDDVEKINEINTLNGVASLDDRHIIYVDESRQKLIKLELQTN